MAPLRPLPGHAAEPSRSILKKGSGPAQSPSNNLFPRKKEDKRRIKHAQLMSKVTKSTTQKQRRRRPQKKLVTTLDALADALPSDEDLDTSTGDAAGEKPGQQINIIKRKSIKSKPGAMKRREKVDRAERDRFAKNLAQLNTPQSHNQQQAASRSVDKWKALRGFINQTLEKRTDLPLPKG